MFRRIILSVFVSTLAISLIGGIAFVLLQAGGIAVGQGGLLTELNTWLKTPVCVSASICAVAGFLLSYGARPDQTAPGKNA